MHVCLFDEGYHSLEPLALTRPVFDLLCGQTSLAAKQIRHFAPCQVGVLVRPHLAALYILQHPTLKVNDLAWLRSEPAILVNGRWLPPKHFALSIGGPCLGMAGDEMAYAVVGAELLEYCSPQTLADCLDTWKRTLPQHAAGGRFITYPWDLVNNNAEQLYLDWEKQVGPVCRTGPGSDADCNQVPLGKRDLHVVGPAEKLLVDPSAHIDPLVVANTTQGPVVIDRLAVVTAFTRLEGPCYIGPGTHVVGAKIRAGTTLGPQCRIGGEVEASIVHGYSNKYHDGFLGHAYVGEWVNLGAGTNNSDLRNDYGEVHVSIHGRSIATGSTKVGCLIGDHTKTGLGTLFNTGTNVGIFCNLLPTGPLAPNYVPSFTNFWTGKLRENGNWAQLLETARTVMHRRGCALTDAHGALYGHVFEETVLDRRHAFREVEQRQLRRSA
jgi:UDP-N-acetylglucosamine diphosphorylase/glucosamine-1-phosphate N-acetyltransferase